MRFILKRPWIITATLTIFILLSFFAFSTDVSRAQGWNDWRGYVPGGIQGSLQDYIKAIINAALLLAGVVAVAYLIIGGYKYVTSSGNAEAVEAAKTTILNAIIGLVIIFAAYVIVDFVYRIITDGAGNGGGGILDPGGGGGDTPGGGDT